MTKLIMGYGCRTCPSGYIGWRSGTTTLCNSRLFSQRRDYEFGYWPPVPSMLTPHPYSLTFCNVELQHFAKEAFSFSISINLANIYLICTKIYKLDIMPIPAQI
jgi:hypothetical protein